MANASRCVMYLLLRSMTIRAKWQADASSLCSFPPFGLNLDPCTQVKMNVMTSAEEQVTVSGHGMPRKAGGRGDLIVHLKLCVPRLSAEQKSKICQTLGSGSGSTPAPA